MPDQEPRTGGGIALISNGGIDFWVTYRDKGDATHIARTVPKDEAREAVVAAARAYREAAPGDDRDARDRAYLRLGAALASLDALDAS